MKGYKTLIQPSKAAMQKHHQRLQEVIRSHKAAPQAALIQHLNRSFGDGRLTFLLSVVRRLTPSWITCSTKSCELGHIVVIPTRVDTGEPVATG